MEEKKFVEHESTEEQKDPKESDKGTVLLSKENEKMEPFSFGVSQSGFGNLSSGFGSGAGFSFGFLDKKDSEPENGGTEVDKDGEDEEASKVAESSETVVEEADALFSKKCKLFYKKEVQYCKSKLIGR